MFHTIVDKGFSLVKVIQNPVVFSFFSTLFESFPTIFPSKSRELGSAGFLISDKIHTQAEWKVLFLQV